MENFIYYLIVVPFKEGDWFLGILGLLLAILVLIVIFLVFGYLFFLIDSSFSTEMIGDAKIVHKWIVPAHTQTIYNKIGNVLVPSYVHVPTAYKVKVLILRYHDTVDVSEYIWDQLEVHTTRSVNYVSGRFTQCVYVKSFNL